MAGWQTHAIYSYENSKNLIQNIPDYLKITYFSSWSSRDTRGRRGCRGCREQKGSQGHQGRHGCRDCRGCPGRRCSYRGCRGCRDYRFHRFRRNCLVFRHGLRFCRGRRNCQGLQVLRDYNYHSYFLNNYKNFIFQNPTHTEHSNENFKNKNISDYLKFKYFSSCSFQAKRGRRDPQGPREYRIGSRFVNGTSQISESYSVQMEAAMKQRKLAFGQKRLRDSRAITGTLIWNLLYRVLEGRLDRRGCKKQKYYVECSELNFKPNTMKIQDR